MKSIIISRVSTDEQKENSPEAQAFRIETYFNNRNYEITKRFNFVESAYKLKRDTFDEIMDFIIETSKKEKIAVGFDKVDRLSRNIFDKRVARLYELAVSDKIELHFVSDGQVIDDKMNAGDKFAFGMKLGLAKYYSDAISDNVKRTFELKRKNGEWTGQPRLGYIRITEKDDRGKTTKTDIVLDPERYLLIREMFELYSTGQYSLLSVRDLMTKKGLRTLNGNKLSKSGIENLLKDSFYYGIAMSKKYGNYPHKYPCIISKDLFDKCQEIRNKRNTKRSKEVNTKEYILKGLLENCPVCGCMITAETHKGNIYYTCTNGKRICKREYIPEKTLLKPILEVLSKFETITEETQEWLLNELRKTSESEVVYHKTQIERINNEYKTWQTKKDNLVEAFIDKSITKEIYDKKLQEYNDRIQLLEIELQEHSKADFDYKTTIGTIVSLARRAKSIFENCSEPAKKRMFLSLLLQNPAIKEKKLYFTIASPFDLVLKLSDNPSWLRGQGSNLRPIG